MDIYLAHQTYLGFSWALNGVMNIYLSLSCLSDSFPVVVMYYTSAHLVSQSVYKLLLHSNWYTHAVLLAH